MFYKDGSYTNEQISIIEAEFDEILAVNAFAGTGKTYTLVAFSQLRSDKKILYLAYNKSIEKEAKEKFKHLSNVRVQTTHGLAYGMFGKKYSKRFEEKGMKIPTKIYAEYCDDVDEKNRYYYAYVLSKIITDFVQSAYTIEQYIEELIKNKKIFEDEFKVPFNYFLSKFEIVWEDLLTNDEMPFEHDFYLKEYQLSEPYLSFYDYILLDEAQDANDCVIDIIMQQYGTKKVFIGDTFQQIYGWRGAVNALDKVRKNALVLFLTQSFRCGQHIAEIANNYLRISNAPKDFIGNENVKDDEAGYKDHAIIARSNAQLFQYLVSYGSGKKIYFVGGIEGYNFRDLVDLVILRYSQDKSKIRNNFFKDFESIEELKEYAESANENEILSKIKVSMSIPKLSQELNSIKERTVKNKNEADLIVTTAHKSKGLEWDSVLILKGFVDLTKDDVVQEEINLLYVAITRAKKRLISETTLVSTNRVLRKIKKQDKLVYEELEI